MLSIDYPAYPLTILLSTGTPESFSAGGTDMESLHLASFVRSPLKQSPMLSFWNIVVFGGL
jgi:hypothetical protein